MVKIEKTEFKKLYDKACDSWKKKFDEKFKTQVFSQDLEFEETFLEEMEKACDPNQLGIFRTIFKKFLKEDLFTKIKTYSGVCKELGIKELTLKDFKVFGEDASKMLAFHKIKNLERLFNGDWKANLKDSNQNKYYPYFTINSSGGLVFGGSDCYASGFGGGAGLYKNAKTADFIGKNFTDVYEDLI